MIIALCCGVIARFGFVAFVLGAGFLTASIQMPISFYKGVLIPLIRGIQCPSCGEWALVRVACISFGPRFYKCESCGQRCKRSDREAPWLDSSGKDDDDMYKPVPFYGPARRREVWIGGLQTLGMLVGFIGGPAIGYLIWDQKGAMIGAVIVSFLVIHFDSRADKGPILPTRPMLWDDDVDA
jgi:hypothetical protein